MQPTDDVLRRFRAHELDSSRAVACDLVRNRCGELAEAVEDLVPDGREKSLALTKLEEAMFWANAGIARSESEY